MYIKRHDFFVFSGFQKQRFGIFQAVVSQWLRHKTCWGSAFSHARPKHVFHGFCLVACGLSSLTLRKGLPCSKQLFFFVFSGFQKQRKNGCGFAWLGHYFFARRCRSDSRGGLRMFFFVFSGLQKQRFGIFQAVVSQWLGHKTCWGSAFSHARPKHVFHGFCLVACGLSSLTLRKGLPCSRQLFFFIFSGFQKQRFGIFLAAFSHGLGTISLRDDVGAILVEDFGCFSLFL